jgi:hypothetical protein
MSSIHISFFGARCITKTSERRAAGGIAAGKIGSTNRESEKFGVRSSNEESRKEPTLLHSEFALRTSNFILLFAGRALARITTDRMRRQ